MSASAIITKFANASGGSAFPHLGVSRAIFAKQLRDRVSNPLTIDQNTSSLCGPASLLYFIGSRKPALLAQYVVDLYTSGQASLGSLKLEPGTDCRNYRVDSSAISAIDWVMLASLRDSSNSFLDYETPADKAAGITMPAAMTSWLEATGFSDVIEHTTLTGNEDLENLVKAASAHNAGNCVFLFINASVLSGAATPAKKAKKKAFWGTANHWVGLITPVQIDGATISNLAVKGSSVNDDASVLAAKINTTLFTWGYAAGRKLDARRPALNVETFLDHYYGYVSAKL